MKLIVCIDDDCGILFNKRRQSRDGKVIENIRELTDTLFITPFSSKLFDNAPYKVKIEEKMLEKAGKHDFCFVEDKDIAPYEKEIDTLILYKWNRRYPSDFKFTLDLEKAGFSLSSVLEFEGTSHEKITREIYNR